MREPGVPMAAFTGTSGRDAGSGWHITYSAAISACEKGSQWQHSLELQAEMQAQDCTSLTVQPYTCEKGSQWQQSLALLAEMQAQDGTSLTMQP